MYQVLYRKYRPRFFRDVVGQEQVTQTLRNEMKNERISHAYLFTGTRGTGKTTCAKILAKAVNCLNPQDGDPCGCCEMCVGLDNHSVLDVVEIDAASNNGVDSIRALIEETSFTPASAKYRVYIIDEVHMLSTAAFNALLKTLEEPPAHVIFILATTEVHRLLPTILSRCQRFDFKRIPADAMVARLEQIADLENCQLQRDAAFLIARLADGALRDALSILDQCIGAGQEISRETVESVAGVAGNAYLAALADAVYEKNVSAALEIIDQLYCGSKDMTRFCEEAAAYFRNLMIVKTMRHPEKIVVAAASDLEKMKEQATKLQITVLLYALDIFETTLGKMRYHHPRISMEMAILSICSPELNQSTAALAHRVAVLEKAVNMGAVQNRVKSSPSSERTPASEYSEGSVPQEGEGRSNPISSGTANGMDIDKLSEDAVKFNDWPELLEQIKAMSTSMGAALNGSIAYTNGEYMLIEAPDFAFELLRTKNNRDSIRDIVQRRTGRVYKFGPYKKNRNQQKDEDPLLALEQRAKDAGVEVKTNTD